MQFSSYMQIRSVDNNTVTAALRFDIPTSGLCLVQLERTMRNRFKIHIICPPGVSTASSKISKGVKSSHWIGADRLRKDNIVAGEWSESRSEQAGDGLRSTLLQTPGAKCINHASRWKVYLSLLPRRALNV